MPLSRTDSSSVSPTWRISMCASVACACRATFVSASCTMRYSAIEARSSSGGSPSPSRQLTSTPMRRDASRASHSIAALSPRSSSISGRRSAAMRRTEATVSSSSSSIAPMRPARALAARPACRLASSIFSAVRRWPRSSCNSRAMRRRSSSRASTRRSDSPRKAWRERASSSASCLRCVTSLITICSVVCPWSGSDGERDLDIAHLAVEPLDALVQQRQRGARTRSARADRLPHDLVRLRVQQRVDRATDQCLARRRARTAPCRRG